MAMCIFMFECLSPNASSLASTLHLRTRLKQTFGRVLYISLVSMAVTPWTPLVAQEGVERAPITVYVSPTGNDSHSGLSREQALKQIESAVEKVRGGDTIVLLPGTFYIPGTILIKDIAGASEERRLTLRADQPGTTTLSAAWPEAAEGKVEWRDEGDGIYSASESPRRQLNDMPSTTVMGGYEDSLLLRWSTLDELKKGEALWNNSRTGKPAGSTFKTPGYGFATQDGRLYVRLPDRSDPNGKRIVAGTSIAGGSRHPRKDAVLVVDNTPGILIEGIRFEGAYEAIVIENNSEDAVIRNCIFEWCHIGIVVPKGSVVEWNEFSYSGLRKLMNECRELNGRFDGGNIFSLGYHHIWMFGAFVGHTGPPGLDVDIRYNYVNQAWDGLWFGGFRNSHCRHNIFQDCVDNVVEFEQAYAPDLYFHHNLILGAPNGVISQARPGGNMLGPHYIYRNVIVGYDDPGWNSWTLLKLRGKGKSKGFVYHHNLFWVGKSSLYWRTQDNKDWMAALKSMDFRNNVIIAESLSLPDGVPFSANHNVLAGGIGENKDLQGSGGSYVARGIEALGFKDAENFDFTLKPGSPLINAGEVTPSRFAAEIQERVKDGKPDVGPFELGEVMGADWPRPRRTVFNAAPFAREGYEIRLVEPPPTPGVPRPASPPPTPTAE